ncbi:hypothetical protein AOE01nite_35000 [Acetobacter oeni]|uniref:Transcriptional regulator n=1 Tax=Acetobacter oeni TaxID=304077 RepID=A0A511XQW0_9PROT|nr:nucleoid DNA-binding protein [Acetobacter oeni]NHO20721.1 hypothetical protein [Acetobacter oeni]GEN65276.1 hypothetical protein AOE01nite_35000 [Acetobacter oeni]
MSKAFIAAVLQDSMESTGVAASKAADDLIEALVSELEKTGSFTLPGFGTFRVKDTPARSALNPRTLETVQVEAGRTVRFKASPVLKARVAPPKPATRTKKASVRTSTKSPAKSAAATDPAAAPAKKTRARRAA